MSSGGGGENNENKSNIPMAAIEFTDNSSITVNQNQPRQPSNLQDLFRFSVEASTNENLPTQQHYLPMDEERRRFLEETLKHMTFDVVEMLLKAIDVLRRAGNLDLEDDPVECEEALELIANYVDNMDTANDFHKIGGFSIFRSCLDSSHSSLRWRSAEIIAELTQNNPYCQERILEAGLLPYLLSLLDSDPNQQVRVKALYAISCLVRENKDAQKAFGQAEGYSVLLRAMQSHVEKLQIKSAFLLTSLCNQNPSVKDELCQMGFVEQLVALITEDYQPVLEHLLSALLAMVDNHHISQEECRRPELRLRVVLSSLIRNMRGKDEYREVYDYARYLRRIVFSGDFEEDR